MNKNLEKQLNALDKKRGEINTKIENCFNKIETCKANIKQYEQELKQLNLDAKPLLRLKKEEEKFDLKIQKLLETQNQEQKAKNDDFDNFESKN